MLAKAALLNTAAALPDPDRLRQPADMSAYRADRKTALDGYLEDARLVGKVWRPVGISIAEMFTGKARNYEQRSDKGKARLMEKVRARYFGDYSSNLDYLACRVKIHNLGQARRVLDAFWKPGNVVLPNGRKIAILEVEDNLTRYNPEKSGLPVLSLKFAMPFARENGEEAVHIGEMQFVPEQAVASMDKSHKAFEDFRRLLALKQQVESGMDAARLKEPTDPDRLVRLWSSFDRAATTANGLREKANQEARQNVPWLADIIGYQPCDKGDAPALYNQLIRTTSRTVLKLV